MKWSDPAFKAMQEAWYLRLAESGFEDAEELVDGELCLKQHGSHPLSGKPRLIRETREQYFAILTQRIADTKFRSFIDRFILTRYAEGSTVQTIVKELKLLGAPRCRNTVTIRIRIYEMLWGLRRYSPRQIGMKI